jgi:alpha-L-fucosidase
VAARQGTASEVAPERQVGTWGGETPGTEWKEFRVDLTKQVTRIGQYEITFAAPGVTDPGLAFRDWELQMYGQKTNGAIEFLKDRSTFRITRSQQTLDQFPTIFRVKIKCNSEGRSGVVTIRMLTY